MVVASVCKTIVLDNKLPDPTNLTFHAIFGATLLIGAFTQRERYHKALIVFGIAAFVLYIVLLFARMQ
jgi:ammonia channel protein AmtB